MKLLARDLCSWMEETWVQYAAQEKQNTTQTGRVRILVNYYSLLQVCDGDKIIYTGYSPALAADAYNNAACPNEVK